MHDRHASDRVSTGAAPRGWRASWPIRRCSTIYEKRGFCEANATSINSAVKRNSTCRSPPPEAINRENSAKRNSHYRWILPKIFSNSHTKMAPDRRPASLSPVFPRAHLRRPTAPAPSQLRTPAPSFAVENRFARPTEQPRILELLEVRQVAEGSRNRSGRGTGCIIDAFSTPPKTSYVLVVF